MEKEVQMEVNKESFEDQEANGLRKGEQETMTLEEIEMDLKDQELKELQFRETAKKERAKTDEQFWLSMIHEAAEICGNEPVRRTIEGRSEQSHRISDCNEVIWSLRNRDFAHDYEWKKVILEFRSCMINRKILSNKWRKTLLNMFRDYYILLGKDNTELIRKADQAAPKHYGKDFSEKLVKIDCDSMVWDNLDAETQIYKILLFLAAGKKFPPYAVFKIKAGELERERHGYILQAVIDHRMLSYVYSVRTDDRLCKPCFYDCEFLQKDPETGDIYPAGGYTIWEILHTFGAVDSPVNGSLEKAYCQNFAYIPHDYPRFYNPETGW